MGTARSAIRLGAALILAGAAFDSPSLYVPGVAIALLWGGTLVWIRLVARGARIERERGPATVVEGEPYPLRIRIRRGIVPPRGELVDPLLERPIAVRASDLARVRRHNVTLRFPRRGRRLLEAATLAIGDPLGLRRAELKSDDGGEVLVLPRTESVLASADRGGAGSSGMPEELGGGGESGSAHESQPIDFEIDGLRPYRDGSPASRIYWPAVARTGELHERRFVAGAESIPLVVVDPARPDDEESLDRAVRAAASLCLHLASSGGCALLLAGEGRPVRIDPGLRAWPEAHARLALVTSRDGSPAVGRTRRAEAVFWVSGRSGERPGRGASGLAARIAYLVTPNPVPGLRTTFSVAGCHGQALAFPRRRHVARTRTAA